MPSKELETLPAVEAALKTGAELPEMEPQDATEAARAIVARILDAPDVDAVFDQGKATSAVDVLDVPLLILNIRWQRSEYEGEGSTVYALIDAERADNGDELTITCGSRNVMAQLYRLAQLGALGTPVKIVRSEKATARGFKPMWLARA